MQCLQIAAHDILVYRRDRTTMVHFAKEAIDPQTIFDCIDNAWVIMIENSPRECGGFV